MRKGLFLILTAGTLLVGGFLGYFSARPSEAQRNTSSRFEYAVINGNYQPYPAEGPSVVSAAVNICYLQAVGCQNEEIRTEVNLSKFAQDERLDNTAAFRRLAQGRAVQSAYSRAMAKLGSDGWEIVEAPQIEFDLFYTNAQGIQAVKEGTRTERRHVWFKRERL